MAPLVIERTKRYGPAWWLAGLALVGVFVSGQLQLFVLGTSKPVGAGIGSVLCGIGAIVVFRKITKRPRPTSLMFSTDGLAFTSPKENWSVRWDEVANVDCRPGYVGMGTEPLPFASTYSGDKQPFAHGLTVTFRSQDFFRRFGPLAGQANGLRYRVDMSLSQSEADRIQAWLNLPHQPAQHAPRQQQPPRVAGELYLTPGGWTRRSWKASRPVMRVLGLLTLAFYLGVALTFHFDLVKLNGNDLLSWYWLLLVPLLLFTAVWARSARPGSDSRFQTDVLVITDQGIECAWSRRRAGFGLVRDFVRAGVPWTEIEAIRATTSDMGDNRFAIDLITKHGAFAERNPRVRELRIGERTYRLPLRVKRRAIEVLERELHARRPALTLSRS
ncbi:hypothetical protein [Amycolatopsis suaedae]|uniref:Uncharacterized protein n=1 Tax=Amycolatopsis suaedae TaxID=2510978 RepID=A0A4Q7JD32_9PSEU|nr:hypothetical protein [Amycolatopsis suaedae]RZQ64254.1 hypothetical protein EWH70_09745 [Amycolatopsis suaedae]